MKHFLKYLFLILLLQKSLCIYGLNQHAIDSLQSIIKSTQNDTIKVAALISLSEHYRQDNSNKTFVFGTQALTLAQNINAISSIGTAHNNLGDVYWYKGDFGSSSEHYFKALKIFEDINDKLAIADCYRNIGWIYYHQKNYIEALNYYTKSLTINQELNRKKNIVQNQAEIAIIYTEQNKYDEAINMYNNTLQILEKMDTKQGMAAIYGNMSTVYEKMGKLNLAIEAIEKSIPFAEKDDNKEYLSGSYNNLGGCYIELKKYNEANAALQKSMKYAKEIGYKNLMQDTYQNFTELYEKQKEFQQAFEYSQLASMLKDSIYNESNNRQANEMTAKYESEKKELMINNLEKDKEHEKFFRIYLIIFCLLIAAFATVLFRGNIQKRKANLALSFAYKEIELKNKDITDSINYSKHIQDASLPSMELKRQLFPDSFILFKPKDIVSGDFYWFNNSQSGDVNKRIIACCDCTGHGVPGALMSMIGNNILNQIVNEKEITSPAQILNNLHKEVRKALKQEEQSGTKDGMDIALITFISETEIEYAGAQRPLWIIKKIDNEELAIDSDLSKQLIEIKPDKFSIGGLQSESERKFTEHKISLNKGDCIYIFSDGIVDQFGGNEGKKFMTKNFKQLLLSINSKPMVEQAVLLKRTIEEWKGNRDQIDDILLIGIRI
jgi:serine phosphatase RsbU (regulator of sigma subunit)/lipopolysaccharide biosynthesis regulator YciM